MTNKKPTTRMLQVAAGIYNGETFKQIAKNLNISKKTVEKHRARLSRELGLKSISQVTRWYALTQEKAG